MIYCVAFQEVVRIWYASGMNVVTIPKKLAGKGDLVVLPREEYESLKARVIPEVRMTADEKRALVRARKNFRAGKLLSLDEFRRELGRPRGSKRH